MYQREKKINSIDNEQRQEKPAAKAYICEITTTSTSSFHYLSPLSNRPMVAALSLPQFFQQILPRRHDIPEPINHTIGVFPIGNTGLRDQNRHASLITSQTPPLPPPAALRFSLIHYSPISLRHGCTALDWWADIPLSVPSFPDGWHFCLS